MRHRGRFLALAVIVATATVAQGGTLVSLGRARLPVYYDQSAAKAQLEIEIAQKSYGAVRPTIQYDGFRANLAIEQHKESVTAEEVVIRYVEHLLKEDYEPIVRFYAPGADGAAAMQAARALRNEIAGLSEIAFLSEWFYKGAKFLLVDFRLQGGTSRIVGFGFRNTPQGFLLSLGGGADEDILLGVFGQVSETIARGRTKDYASRPFEHSISLGEGLFGISLKFDGALYGAEQDWRPPDGASAANSPRAFAELVLARSGGLDDEAFVGLWCVEDVVALAAESRATADVLAQVKQSHAANGRIMHVLTMAFGEDFAHYFIEESDPDAVRSMFVGKSGDGFCLSRGPDDRRVSRLLRSEVLKDGIWDLWVALRGS